MEIHARSLASPVTTQVSTKLSTLVRSPRPGSSARASGPPRRHTPARCSATAPTPAAGYAAAAARYPDEPAIIDELGTLTLQGGPRAHQRARARARRRRRRRRATASRSCAATTAGSIDAVVACSKLGANALFLNTAFSGPQLADVAKREKPKAMIYDHEFAEVLHDAARRRKRYVAWHEPEDGKPNDPPLERPDRRAATPPTSRRRPSAGPRDHPHLRHDRHAEGRLALAAASRSTRSRRCCA